MHATNTDIKHFRRAILVKTRLWKNRLLWNLQDHQWIISIRLFL